VWNGSKLELSNYTYTELNTRIANLKQNRVQLSTYIQKIRLDLGQVRKFDFFNTEDNIRLLETQLLRLIPLVRYAESSETNINSRITAYTDLVTSITDLYDKYKGLGDPIIAEITANNNTLLVLKKRLALITPTITSLESKSVRLENRMYALDSYARRISKNLNSIYVDITTLSDANFQLSKTKASLENTLSVIDTKMQLNTSNIDSTYSRLCDINLTFSSLYTELTSVLNEMQVATQDVDYLNRTAETSNLGLARLNENISILKSFYLDADEKVRAIESYLSSFIIGGDNVRLNFGTDYTIVHAIPPAMPPCPDPEPCEGSLTPIIVTSKPTTTTTTTALPTTNITTKPSVTTTVLPKRHCSASDADYLGCFIVYCSITYHSVVHDGCNSPFSNGEIISIECYWDAESRIEAQTDAQNIADVWNRNNEGNTICTTLYKLVEIQDADKCREYYLTDMYIA
jgi:hypothetical protein